MPFKNREARLAYHQTYFREHREALRTYENGRRDATNTRRRERYRRNRAGLPSGRVTHGKTHTREYLLLSGAKKRAKRSGLPCSLTVHDMPSIPQRCPVLGIPIVSSPRRMSDSSPSLDRIKPALGYVRGNVRVVSWRANRLRCDGTAAELLLVAKDAARLEASHA